MVVHELIKVLLEGKFEIFLELSLRRNYSSTQQKQIKHQKIYSLGKNNEENKERSILTSCLAFMAVYTGFKAHILSNFDDCLA